MGFFKTFDLPDMVLVTDAQVVTNKENLMRNNHNTCFAYLLYVFYIFKKHILHVRPTKRNKRTTDTYLD